MNMRKIIAVLAAVLMLCAAIPMGAMSVAADGDVVIDYNFDDGVAHFERGYVENGYMVFDGTTAPWQNAYLYANAMKANTDYVATFSAKADKDANLGLKINNNWAGDTAEKYVSVTTEWQDFEIMFNTSELADLTSTALVMFYSPYDAAGAPIYCIDNLKIVEYVEPAVPGTIINGDFETGDLSGWEHHQSTAISTDAHSGSYAANLKGDGGWGGMLNQDIPVEAGKTYKVSIWAKANANGANVQIKDGGTSGANLASQWFTATEWTELVWEVIPTTDVLCFNFCGGGNGIAEDVLVDDITVAEKVYGQVINGDFSNGSEGWNLSGYASVVDGAIQLDNPTQYNETLSQVVEIEPNTTYEITWKSKRVSGTGAFNLYVIQSVSPWANLNRVDGQNWMNETSGEWVANSYTVNSGDNTSMLLKVSTESAATPGVILLDDVVVTKVIEPEQPDESIVWNADFNDGDKKFTDGSVVAEGPDGSNCLKWTATGGWSATYIVLKNMDPNKDYSVTMKVKASVEGNMGITIQNGDWSQHWNATPISVTTEWTDIVYNIPANTYPFNAGSIMFKFQDVGLAMDLYVDDIVISEGLVELPEQSYPINGDFETGKVAPWENLYGSCPTVEIVEGGLDSDYALHIVSKKWNHVRQTAIPVEPNTWYKVTAWAKNTSDMILLVKDGGDSANLNQTGMTAGEEWTEFSGVFYTGDYTTIIISLMGGDNDEVADKYGTFDNVTLEVTEEPVCEHEYDDCLDADCNLCGETREPGHNLTHFEAVVATNCQETGHAEYWYCENCNCYFGDAEATWQHNPGWLFTTGDCVRPEGAADCATVPCELCGNDIYGYGDHDTGVPACQDGHCSKCDQDIAGYGHQNYDGPACLPGNCYYCGEAMEPVAHENGAWAPCLEGECSYGCGLTYPATADHVDEDGDLHCDTCWSAMPHDCIDEDANGECDICYNTMPHDCIDEDGDHHCDICWGVMPHDCIDEDANGECDICWNPMPEEPPVVEIIYGDADGDGEITLLDATVLTQYLSGYEVTLAEDAADADGDGEITLLDATVLTQYLSGYDVTLGPQG